MGKNFPSVRRKNFLFSICLKIHLYVRYSSLRRLKLKLVTNFETSYQVENSSMNLSLDQVTKEDNRSNKHYLYKLRDYYTEVWDKIYLKETLFTDQHFMTFRLKQNYHKKLCSYVNATYVISTKCAYLRLLKKC